MTYRTIISVAQLRERLGDPSVVIFDCRHDLMQPEKGALAYKEAHVPGARFAHSDRDLSGAKNGRTGRHPLPEPAVLMAWLGANGVDATRQVVAYDYVGGASATRLWWMLRWLGHDEVSVLDGGWARWTSLGLPVDTAVPSPLQGDFVERPRPGMVVDAAAVLASIGVAGVAMLDARAPERYRGDVEPIDAVAGHVPGARNRPFVASLGPDGRFLPPAQLRAALLEDLGGTPSSQAIAMCGSGVTACHLLLAMEHAGLGGGRLYPGSWSEWSRDPSRPVARGPEP